MRGWRECTVTVGGEFIAVGAMVSIDRHGHVFPAMRPRSDLTVTATLRLVPGAFERLSEWMADEGKRQAARLAVLARSTERAQAIAARRAATRSPDELGAIDRRHLPKRARMRVARALERLRRTEPRGASMRRCRLDLWRARMGGR